jgi:hypothetical protein
MVVTQQPGKPVTRQQPGKPVSRWARTVDALSRFNIWLAGI